MATAAAGQLPPRVIVIGDSLTYGIGVDPSQRWALRLGDLVEHHVQDFSRSGMQARHFRRSARPILDTLTSDLSRPRTTVVIMLGTNDWGGESTTRRFRTDYRKILKATQGMNVICITPPSRCQEIEGVERRGGVLEAFREVIREVCPGPVLEGKSIIPFDGSGNFADCVHPSALGHSKIAEAVAGELVP